MKAKRHSSMILLGFFSACYFAAMVVARKVLNEDDLYLWNSVATLMTIGFGFCFLGAENLLIRHSKIEGQILTINRHTIALLFISTLIYTALITIISKIWLFKIETTSVYLTTAILNGLLVFNYNILRLKQLFARAQIAANSWKLTTLLALLSTSIVSVEFALAIGLFVGGLASALLLYKHSRSIRIISTPQPTDWLRLYFSFAYSLFVALLLNNADRLLIAQTGNKTLFSDYVYLTSLVLLPFSLISNYIGFREAATFKREYDPVRFRKKNRRIIALTAIMFATWFGLLLTFRNWLELPVQIIHFLPCIAIVVCRSANALQSALFGIKGTALEIYKANTITITGILVLSFIALKNEIDSTAILILVAAAWIIRTAVYNIYTKKIKGYQNEDAI